MCATSSASNLQAPALVAAATVRLYHTYHEAPCDHPSNKAHVHCASNAAILALPDRYLGHSETMTGVEFGLS